MKVLAFTVFCFAIFGAFEANPQGLALYQRANKDADLAEEIKQVIDNVWTYIPDEIGFKDWEIKLPSTFFFGGQFSIKEVGLSGLKKLDIKTLTYDPENSRLDYEFNFGDIVGAIDYSFDITGLFKIDHHFIFNIDLKDLTTQGYAVMAVEDGRPKKITDFKVLVTLGDSQFDIKGFLNNEKFSQELTDFLNKHVATVFDQITPMLSPIVSELLKTAINIALNILG